MVGKILVVDDEPGIRDVVKTYIEYSGYSVHTAADGVDALQLVENENYDVVLSDIQMPRMDGLTLAEKIHKIQPDTIVILMTGYASVNTAVEAIKKDIFDYIMKPFQNMQAILQTIERGIEQRRFVQERRALIDDLKRANDELSRNRILLTEKVDEIDTELKNRIDRMTTLYDISQSISSITNIDDLLQQIMDRVISIMVKAGGIFWLVDFETNRLRRVVTMGLNNEEAIPALLHISEGELGATINTGRVSVFRKTDELGDPVFKKICVEENISSLIMVPLGYEEDVLGVINLFFRDNYLITDDDISLLKAIADQAAVSVKNAELFASQQKMFSDTIQALATAIDSRDHYTGGHSYMVTQYALKMAERVGLDEKDLELMQIAGLLHDIGKIGISDTILNKPGKLTEEEMNIIKAHPILGHTIIESIDALKPVSKIIYHHHEHYDGKGYPEGLKGEDIPLMSRILTVSDVFHALTSDRIYRKGMPLDKALAIMREETGTTFDPDIMTIFFQLVEEEEILPAEQVIANAFK